MPGRELEEVRVRVVEPHGGMALAVGRAIVEQQSSRQKSGRLPPHLTTNQGCSLRTLEMSPLINRCVSTSYSFRKDFILCQI